MRIESLLGYDIRKYYEWNSMFVTKAVHAES